MVFLETTENDELHYAHCNRPTVVLINTHEEWVVMKKCNAPGYQPVGLNYFLY